MGSWRYALFYGGRVYGIDEHGNELHDLLDDPTFSKTGTHSLSSI